MQSSSAAASDVSVCARFRHMRHSHFTCCTFCSPHYLVAGDVDGLVHVFSLKSLSQVSVLNTADGRVSFSVTVGEIQLFDVHVTPHGVLGLGVQEQEFSSSETESNSNNNTENQQKSKTKKTSETTRKRRRRLLWVHLRSSQIVIFDADDLIPTSNNEEDSSSSTSSEDEESEDEEEGEETEKSNNQQKEQQKQQQPRIQAHVYLQPLRSFSFAASLCLPSKVFSNSFLFLCPHEDTTSTQNQSPSSLSSSSAAAGGVGSKELEPPKTVPSLQYFVVGPHNSTVPFTVRDNGNLSIASSQEKAISLGQVMCVSSFFNEKESENENENEKDSSTTTTSSSAAEAEAVLLGLEGGFLNVVEILQDEKALNFSSKQVSSQVRASIKVASDPIMAISSSNNRNKTNNNNNNRRTIVCGSAEGTVCCLTFSLLQNEQKEPQIQWSSKLSTGVGHLVFVPSLISTFSSYLLAFLWNGETKMVLLDNDDAEKNEKEHLINIPASSSSSSNALRPEGGGVVSGISSSSGSSSSCSVFTSDQKLVRMATNASIQRSVSTKKRTSNTNNRKQNNSKKGILAIAGKNGSLSIVSFN